MGEAVGLSDLQLIDGVVLRQESDLAEIYRRHAGAILATARMVLGSSSVCDDVVAEVFLALWLNPQAFESERGSLLGFLRLKARGRSIDIVRSEVARRRREETDARDRRGSGSATDEDFLSSEAAEQMHDALASLTERERQPIELAFFTGMTYVEIAKYLELPEGTVKSRIRTGLHHVRVIYEAQRVAETRLERSLPPRERWT
jgi:RNA polymerase sigma-70 factor (ECF subfamily)